MGRETKILLTLLGLLAGAFLGVVSMKLFVPRPPHGTGPDVHADTASAEPQDLVAPPELAPPQSARPLEEPSGSRFSRFTAAAPSDPPRDPFLAQASFETPGPDGPLEEDLPPPRDLQPPPHDLSPPPRDLSLPRDLPSPPHELSPPPPNAPVPPAAVAAAPVAGGVHVTRSGDSWWSIAERAYGDGRFYRALFAWNRSLDPRVTLVPGTRLQIPPTGPLRAAWPTLLPGD